MAQTTGRDWQLRALARLPLRKLQREGSFNSPASAEHECASCIRVQLHAELSAPSELLILICTRHRYCTCYVAHFCVSERPRESISYKFYLVLQSLC